MKGPLRNLATKICDRPILIFGLRLNVYLSSQTVRTVFFYKRGDCVLYCIISCTVFLSFKFSRNFRASKTKNGDVALDEPPQGSVSESVDHSRNSALCYRFPTLYEVIRLVLKC